MVRIPAVLAAVVAAFTVLAGYAPPAWAARCRVEVVRTAPDRAHFGASCGGTALAEPPVRESKNQLDAIPLCSALGRPPCTPATPGAAENLPTGVGVNDPPRAPRRMP